RPVSGATGTGVVVVVGARVVVVVGSGRSRTAPLLASHAPASAPRSSIAATGRSRCRVAPGLTRGPGRPAPSRPVPAGSHGLEDLDALLERRVRVEGPVEPRPLGPRLPVQRRLDPELRGRPARRVHDRGVVAEL